MAYLEDKIQQVQDKALRDILLAEVKKLKKEKKFGLVFEDHVPELVPVYSAPIRPRSTVALKDGDLQETFRVIHIEDGVAFLSKDAGDRECVYPLDKLVVVQRFGEAIYPALIPMATVENGGERPFHTLIEADNYHALQLLEYLYAGQVDCIYIDPPYNTGAKDWKYNNNYVDDNDSWRHSKWLAMMKKRLYVAERLLKPEGIICITIDDYEIHHLRCLLEGNTQDFKSLEAVGQVVIRNNPQGRSTQRGFSVNHEYALFFAKKGADISVGRLPRSGEQQARYPLEDDDGISFFWENLRKSGSDSDRIDRPKQFYPLYWDGSKIRIPAMDWNATLKVWENIESPIEGEITLWPIRQKGDQKFEKVWKESSESLRINPSGYTVRELRGKMEAFRKNRINTAGMLPTTLWSDSRMSATEHGTNLIANIFAADVFSFPKSIYAVIDSIRTCCDRRNALIVDFFAGSGTTLNAVNLMNAADNGTRRCILVTNNEVSAEKAKTLQERGLMPGDAEYEKYGICQSVTYPRNKYTILGRRDDGTLLDGDYLTGRTITKDKRRTFKQIGFIDKSQLATSARKKELAALLDGIPQSKIDKDKSFFVDETCTASVLFDDACVDAYLDALDDMTHIEVFYLVTVNNALFKRLKDAINESLGPLQVSENEKRPLSAGFEANLAYFKLDFLRPDEVQLGRQFAALVPILWLMAGTKGACPDADDSKPFFIPERCPFAVLLDEHCFLSFKQLLQTRPDISHVFLVTHSEEGFFSMRDELDAGLQVTQLYKNYLDRFKINTE